MKIDLHVHTKERSSCAKASEDEQIQAAIRSGLEALAITDHHRLVPDWRLRALNKTYAPFRVFGGIEVTTEGEDVLVLGVPDARLERQGWSYADLHDLIQERSGFMALAHPFRYSTAVGLPLERFPLHAIEVHSPNTPPAAEESIRLLATRLGVPLLSNSDAHSTGRLGSFYNQLAKTVCDEGELIAALKAGEFTIHPR